MPRIIDVFPTLQILERSAVTDVAAFLLSELNARDEVRFIRSNVVGGYGDEYASDTSAGGTHDQRRRRGRLAVAEAMAYLFSENFVADDGEPGVSGGQFVTRLGRTIRTRNDFSSYARASLLPRELLREDLAEIVMPLFLAGHYDDAVSAAFKRVEIAVRQLGGFSNEDYGVPLMRDAFGETGPLTDKNAVRSEREALSHLFAGVIGYFKNPLSHREIGIDDARQAASRILFANEMIAIVILQYRLLHPEAVKPNG
jgi:uncharacterized protein (TIGR02391 family)